MSRALCSATYSAQQVPGAVVVFADGWHPTSGYPVWFEQAQIAVFPPQFTLCHSEPAGPTLQVITPFRVYVMFEASEPVKEVLLHDVNGEHKVKVTQTPDISSLKGRCVAGRVIAAGGSGGGGEVPIPFKMMGGEIPTPFFRAGGDIPGPFSKSPFGVQKRRVLSVNSIEFAILKSNPPMLGITSDGTVGSLGWHSAELVSFIYIQPPVDGIWDFDFVAQPPDSPTPQILQPISAQAAWPGDFGRLRGIRIHSASNKMEKLL